jgi:hypothetical protein
MFSVFWDVLPCKKIVDRRATFIIRAIIIALMMEAASTSETSVDNYFTRQYIAEDSELHACRRENLKTHIILSFNDM